MTTPNGTVCIVYVAVLSWIGFRTTYGAMELLSPDGKRTVRTGRVPASPGPHGDLLRRCAGVLDGSTAACSSFPGFLDSFELRLELDGASLTATFQAEAGWGAGTGCQVTPHLYWGPVLPRACVRIHLPDQSPSTLEGTGTLDYVHLTRMTRRIGLRRIRWGRIHTDRDAWVFNHLEFARHPTWQAIQHRSASGGGHSLRRFALRGDPAAGDAVLSFVTGNADAEEARVDLRTVRELHCGPAFDAARTPSLLERTAARWISGPMHQTRWLSRAVDRRTGRSGWALHEEVLCV